MEKLVAAIRLLFSPRKKFHAELVNILGYYPRKWKLYELAFIHRSASIFLSDGSTVNNERLEFLGDAILDAVVAEYLFVNYPSADEGFLSKMRSKIVKRKHLNHLALKLGISDLITSNSIINNGGKHMSGNAFEALIGAIYIDKGYKNTRNFIVNKIFDSYVNLEEIENTETDFKSRIIEWAQKNKKELLFDSQEDASVEAHTPLFTSRIVFGQAMLGEGIGNSKKEAEQNAAEQALVYLTNNPL